MASTATLNVLEEVGRERIAQDKEHGGAEYDDQHSENDFIACVVEHLGFASRNEHAGKRQEWIRVAALAVAVVEAMDRAEARQNGAYIPEGETLEDIPF